jgi:hypothetical protein
MPMMIRSESPAGPREEHPGDVVELSLLVDVRQVAALEEAAWLRGLTAAELVRTLLRDFLAESGPGRASADRPRPPF